MLETNGTNGTNGASAIIRNINPNYRGFDYISWYVGNARQAVTYFVSHFGFKVVAYRGPETGSHLTTSYVISNGDARLMLTAPITGPDSTDERASEEDRRLLNEAHAHLTKHGDGVKDIAFQVDDVKGVWEHAVQNGAVSLQKPAVSETDDGCGSVLRAAVRTYGDTVHTLINRTQYTGAFLPGFKAVSDADRLNELLPPVDLIEIDHCVGNQPRGGLDGIVK